MQYMYKYFKTNISVKCIQDNRKQTCLALPMKDRGLLALGLLTIAGVGMDGIGIALLAEFA